MFQNLMLTHLLIQVFQKIKLSYHFQTTLPKFDEIYQFIDIRLESKEKIIIQTQQPIRNQISPQNMPTNNESYPMNTKFTDLMNKMLKTKLRIDDYLDSLVILMSSSKIIRSSRIDRSLIYKTIEKQSSIVGLFKLCILIERCLVKGFVIDCEEIIQAIVEKVQEFAMEKESTSSFEEFMVNKIMKPFLLYLQKRAYDDKIMNHNTDYNQVCHYSEDKSGFQNPQLFQINKINSKSIILNQNTKHSLKPTQKQSLITSQKPQKITKSLQNCFYLINLLNKILTFCPSMLPLIRYFGGYFGCVLDFNITLAMDIQILYNRLNQETAEIQKYLKLIKNKQLCENQLKVMDQMLIVMEQIDRINQGIYIVYYNCYYYKSMSYYVPNFTNTDKIVGEICNKRKMHENQKKWDQISNKSRLFSKDIKARVSSMRKSTFSVSKPKSKPKNMINSTLHNCKPISLSQSFKHSFHYNNHNQYKNHHQQEITIEVLEQSIQIQPQIINNSNKQKQKSIPLVQMQATRSTSLKQSTNSKQQRQHQQQYLFQFVDSEQESDQQQCDNNNEQNVIKNIQKLEQDLQLLAQLSQTLQNMCKNRITKP